MVVPTIFTCIWLTVFGGLGLEAQMRAEDAGLTCGNPTRDGLVKLSCFSNTKKLFELIESFPLGKYVFNNLYFIFFKL